MSTRLARTRATVVKRCSCGASYDRDAWRELRLVGVQRDAVESIELRDCAACPTTIGISTSRVRVVYSVEPAPSGEGFVIWRRAGNGDEIAYGFGAYATRFRSRADAEAVVRSQKRADRSAATRLGVLLVDEDDEHAA